MISEIFFIPMFRLPRPTTWAKSLQVATAAASIEHDERVFGFLPFRVYFIGAVAAHVAQVAAAPCASTAAFAKPALTSAGTSWAIACGELATITIIATTTMEPILPRMASTVTRAACGSQIVRVPDAPPLCH